ncbi:hypothetical protein C2845_PM12G21050 [Panicum miliaceum]|uniref:Uncharacterized protein n=1 Tax=Panicum miliaceum TaxID=4540 RepID=A0A3L6QFA9_PANMI|nr:hypothetical protein C2845_PM12G21050 [Panicum miliaceum]
MRLKLWERRLYTNRATGPGDDNHRLWTLHAFAHPHTFDMLTVDPALRADLLRFAASCSSPPRQVRRHRQGHRLPWVHGQQDQARLLLGPALRVLAKNYLGVGSEGCEEADADPDLVTSLMAEAEGLLAATRVCVTPADIAEA